MTGSTKASALLLGRRLAVLVAIAASRVDPGKITPFLGVGILLSLLEVYRVNSESAGGAIEVESVPGRGSTFRVLLPLEA